MPTSQKNKRKRTEAQLFTISNVIASPANAFSNILTPPGPVHRRFPPIRVQEGFQTPGGKASRREHPPLKSWHVQDARAGEQSEKETALAVGGDPRSSS